MKVILFGATGMVGQGVLRECLLDPRVEHVLSIGRSATGQHHAKLREIVHSDLFDLLALEPELVGFDACFFCLGVSSAGMTEERYKRTTYDLTMAAARPLARLNPQMTFIYVSGAGTDSTGQGRTMWARVKGQTENDLLRLPFKAAYMFRPGAIQPLHGVTSRTTFYRIFYALTRPLLPLLKALFPRYVTTTERLGRAMIEVTAHGAPNAILETEDINRIGAPPLDRKSTSSAMLFCLMLLTGTVAHAQNPPADLRGIYVYSGDVSQISKKSAATVTASLGVPGMDGIVLVIGWDAIEPSMGQYQWSALDQWMTEAVSSRKKVELTITGGAATPPWLFQPAPGGAGVTPVNFTISPHAGATGVCDSETIAAPWDPVFLAHWDSLLVAVAAHLKSTGTYADVTFLRLTGINRTTDELRLPAETPQSTGLACVSNAVTTWQQAGFRPSLLLESWDQITKSFQKSFPDKSFSIAIIPTNAFPAIAEDGSIIKGTPPDANQPLLSLASQRFPGHLAVQFNFLMPGEPASPAVVRAAETLGTLAAFQTNNYFGSSGQGAACSEPVTNPTPCTDLTYLALLQTGIYPLGLSDPLRAKYIEVFPANAIAFPDDIQRAHDELLPLSRRRAAHH